MGWLRKRIAIDGGVISRNLRQLDCYQEQEPWYGCYGTMLADIEVQIPMALSCLKGSALDVLGEEKKDVLDWWRRMLICG